MDSNWNEWYHNERRNNPELFSYSNCLVRNPMVPFYNVIADDLVRCLVRNPMVPFYNVFADDLVRCLVRNPMVPFYNVFADDLVRC